jgi:hypothetical protein
MHHGYQPVTLKIPCRYGNSFSPVLENRYPNGISGKINHKEIPFFPLVEWEET